MKKIVILLLAAVLLLSGCAKRPDKLIDGEETETEIVYEEPPESYLDELAESFHYLNAPDSVFCYTDPLIKEEDYVSPEELEYDLKAKKETRFISCNQYADYPLTMVYADGTETTYSYACPNAVYLTEANGKRTKLCPLEWCRESMGDDCFHLDIPENTDNTEYSIVYGDAVYFIWNNACIGSPDNPRRSEITPFVHMLLRYDLETHTVEKVLDLPGYTWISGAQFGVLYLYTYEQLVDISYMILLDTENDLAAKASLSETGYFSGHVHVKEDGIYIFEYASGWKKCSPSLQIKEKADGLPAEKYSFTGGTDGGWELLMNVDDGTTQTLITGVQNWKNTEKYIYILPWAMPRTVYRYPDTERFSRTEDIVTQAGNTVIRYTKNTNGSLLHSTGEAVFTEKISSEDPEEVLYTIEAYGNTIRVVTVRPPIEQSGEFPVYRRYIIRNSGAVLDGEWW